MAMNKESREIAVNHLEILKDTLKMVRYGARNRMEQLSLYIQNPVLNQHPYSLDSFGMSELREVYQNLVRKGDNYTLEDVNGDSRTLFRIIDNIQTEAGIKMKLGMRASEPIKIPVRTEDLDDILGSYSPIQSG